MRMQLNDKVIIITGGCQGLGRSMAEYFAGKGAKLALVDLNQENSMTRWQPARPRVSRARSLSVQRGQ
jgi:NAD(P)-dependent dehydrogenase (short-subunit alcohol dehydrogenase family)